MLPPQGRLRSNIDRNMKMIFGALPLLLLTTNGRTAPPASTASTAMDKTTPATVVAQNDPGPDEAIVKKGILTIHTGPYLLDFSEKSAWTIRQMFYNGKLLLSQTGAFQTVVNVNPKPGDPVQEKWRGTGHGYETIDSIKLEVDGKSYDVAEGLHAAGKRFTVIKDSRMGPYKSHSEVTLDSERLHENFRYEAIEDDSNVNFIYAFMHCFTKKTEQWRVGLPDGSTQDGTFVSDTSFTLKKDIRWAVLYAPTEQMGVVYSYPEAYKGTSDFTNSFWNRVRDNKLYFRPLLPRGLGQKFGYEVTLQAFTATPEAWEKTASEVLAEIDKQRTASAPG